MVFLVEREFKNRLLMVGYFLSSSVGTRGVGEDLAMQLGESGWRGNRYF